MNRILFLLLFVVASGQAQVGINTTTPNAQLDVKATDPTAPTNKDGMLIPRIDDFPLVSPTADQHGMMVYLNLPSGLKDPGFYYWHNGFADWLPISPSSSDADFYEVGTSSPPLNINANMYHMGDVGIGVSNPLAKLDVESSLQNFIVRAKNNLPQSGSYSVVYKSQIATTTQTNGTIVGFDNYVVPGQNYKAMGIFNDFEGYTTDYVYGIKNDFTTAGLGIRYGVSNQFMYNDGVAYGFNNQFTYNCTSLNIGLRNEFTTSTAERNGVNNLFAGTGNGVIYGLKNTIDVSGNGNLYGTYSNISSLATGTGTKYGNYISINSAGGGVHYGVYSDVVKANSYSGYFLGRFAIGSTTANTYIMPASRGTNGQIMQTDGLGNVTWQNPNTALNNFAWTTTGNSGTNSSTNFIGTTDNVDLVFKRANSAAGRISQFNTSFGVNSQINNNGSSNTSFGAGALYNPTGNSNTAIGEGSMDWINTGSNNTAVGTRTLFNIRAGSENVALGDFSMFFNQSGNRNIAIGSYALQANVSGARNIVIGYNAGYSETGSDKLYIENSSSTTPLLYGEFDTDIVRTNSQRFFINDPTVNGIQMVFKNSNRYQHGVDANLNFGTAGGNFLMATAETNSETAGIRGDGDNISIWSPGDGGRQLRILDEDAWTDSNGNPYDNAAEVAYIANNGQYFQISDKNKKENIRKITDASAKIAQISGYTYQFKVKPSEGEKGEKPTAASGVLAQEIETVLPEAIQKNEYGEYFVDYAAITPLLIEAIKEQNTKIQSLEERLKMLEEKLSK